MKAPPIPPTTDVYSYPTNTDVTMVEDNQAERVSAAAVLQFAAHEARQGRRFTEFGAHAYASIAYNVHGTFLNILIVLLLIQISNKS